MISARERKVGQQSKSIWHDTVDPAPVITRRQSTQHGRQYKKAYGVKNYQQSKHVYLGKLIVSTLLNTL